MTLRRPLAVAIHLLCLFAATLALAHGIDAAHLHLVQFGTNLDYVWLGAVHMFTGYDHILFLFGVVFFLTGIVDIVKFITAFTVGHSLTLLIGTLAGVTANPYLVDAAIAVSVIYKGFDNLDGFRRYLGVEAPDALLLVFAFGLVHGFGLATRIQEFPLPEENLVWRIMSFNVGVEVGQIAALAVILTLVNVWRRFPSFARFSFASNGALAFGGFLLLLMQLHGYAHTTDHHLASAPAQAATTTPAAEILEAASDHLAAMVTTGAVSEAWLSAKPSAPERHRIGSEDAWSIRFPSPIGKTGALTLFLSSNGSSLLSFREMTR